MPKIALENIKPLLGSSYPAPFDQACAGRSALRLAEAAGLSQFGVNIVTLDAGAWSSQRHWHSHEDEFVYCLSGVIHVVEEAGEYTLKAGESAAFKAGDRNGHHLQNRGTDAVQFLVVGARLDADHGEYPDIDLAFGANRYSGGGGYFHKDGTPY